jgi:hypothetical protein
MFGKKFWIQFAIALLIFLLGYFTLGGGKLFG